MRNLLFKPIIFVSIVLGLFVIGEFIAIGGLTWRNHQRLNILESDIRNGHRVEETIFELLQQTHSAKTKARPEQPSDSALLKLQSILTNEHINNSEIIADIRQLQAVSAKALQGDNGSLVQTLDITRQLFARQTREEGALLDKIAEDSQLEFELAVILPLLTFAILYLLGRFYFKRNVLAPLDALKELLQMLIRGDRRPIELQPADPMMRGLFDNYNQLVIRLTELEKEHRNYTTELENKIRQTTSTLLEQSHQIARSERLSVVAELAASTAHELRNPLAGIQLALENILLDCRDHEFWDRLDAVNKEVKRLTRHLNDLLALTRPTSDSQEQVDIERLCDELSQFLKYQIPENVHLSYDIEPNLSAQLPATEFRLALLNLLLNAIQAIGNHSGFIHLSAKQDDGQITLTIEDNGPGFDDALLIHGIRPFVSLKDKGSGLGLTVVQRFVKSQQGTLRLYNNRQGHACVTLTLPVSKP